MLRAHYANARSRHCACGGRLKRNRRGVPVVSWRHRKRWIDCSYRCLHLVLRRGAVENVRAQERPRAQTLRPRGNRAGCAVLNGKLVDQIARGYRGHASCGNGCAAAIGRGARVDCRGCGDVVELRGHARHVIRRRARERNRDDARACRYVQRIVDVHDLVVVRVGDAADVRVALIVRHGDCRRCAGVLKGDNDAVAGQCPVRQLNHISRKAVPL